jgi:phage-related protein
MRPKLPAAQVPLEWVGSSRSDLKAFPEDVQDAIGFALYMAQTGGKHFNAKPLTGDRSFRGAGVLEVMDDADGDAYRAAYTVRFAGVVYVLHAFQKKANRGIATPKNEIARIKTRLRMAREHYYKNFAKREAG